MRGRSLGRLIAGTCLVAACTAGGAPAAEPPVEVTVFAAASLASVVDEARPAFEQARPDIALTVSTDSSAALRTQIEQGAPADVFLSADVANPQALVEAGLADGEPIRFAQNVLTVIVPAANPAGLASPADLARPGLKVLAAGEKVPITRYADQLVRKLAELDGYPPDFVAGYAANVVSREDNVTAVVAKVGLGEADAGIVYVTDAARADGVATLSIPPAANVTATYAGIVVGGSPHPAEARAFLEWLAGPDGRSILGAAGFLPPP